MILNRSELLLHQLLYHQNLPLKKKKQLSFYFKNLAVSWIFLGPLFVLLCAPWRLYGGGDGRVLWEQWPGSVGCCSWSINGPALCWPQRNPEKNLQPTLDPWAVERGRHCAFWALWLHPRASLKGHKWPTAQEDEGWSSTNHILRGFISTTVRGWIHVAKGYQIRRLCLCKSSVIFITHPS